MTPSPIGAFTERVIVDCFALTGVHCETARLIFKDRMPAALHKSCTDVRRTYLATGEAP